MTSEWSKYGIPADPFEINRNPHLSSALTIVRHTAHISDAIRIIEDGTIRSSLVWDESRLNNTRTCVSWVSANWWADGSIYGNISFEFDWRGIVGEKKLYWVEAITIYNPDAYRFLITCHDPKDLPVTPYNPCTEVGPVILDKNDWHWNGMYTSEFLIDADLSLDSCCGITFVDHHRTKCRKDRRHCPELGLQWYNAGAIFLANLVGRNLTSARGLLLDSQDPNKLKDEVHVSIDTLLGRFQKHITPSTGTEAGDRAEDVVRAALMAYGNRKTDMAYRLAGLLGSVSAFEEAYRQVIEDYFGVEVPSDD